MVSRTSFRICLLSDQSFPFQLIIISPAVVFCLVFGLQAYMSPWYLLYFVLLTAVIIGDLQFKLDGYYRAQLTSMQAEKWKTVACLGLTDVIAFWLLSERSEDTKVL